VALDAGEFRGYLTQNLAMKVHGAGGAKLAIVGALNDDGTVVVVTQFVADGAAGKPINRRVVNTAAGWRLCDIVASDVGMVTLMRSQMDAALPNDRADIRSLTRPLHEQSLG
jgi:ABC-type transporter MlaC component